MTEQDVVAALWRYYLGHCDARKAITEAAFSRAMAQANTAEVQIEQYAVAQRIREISLNFGKRYDE